MKDEENDNLREITDALATAMFHLCLCGICENARNPDEDGVYYLGGECDRRLLCCLGGYRHPRAACGVKRLADYTIHKVTMAFDLKKNKLDLRRRSTCRRDT